MCFNQEKCITFFFYVYTIVVYAYRCGNIFPVPYIVRILAVAFVDINMYTTAPAEVCYGLYGGSCVYSGAETVLCFL